MYYKGAGVPQDYKKAMSLYKKGGSPAAYFKLGDMYYEGAGVPQDFKRALFWYSKANKSGIMDASYPPADYKIGLMHENGHGVRKSRKQALYWYQGAGDGGSAKAKARMKKLGSPYRSRIQRLVDRENAKQRGRAAEAFMAGIMQSFQGETWNFDDIKKMNRETSKLYSQLEQEEKRERQVLANGVRQQRQLAQSAQPPVKAGTGARARDERERQVAETEQQTPRYDTAHAAIAKVENGGTPLQPATASSEQSSSGLSYCKSLTATEAAKCFTIKESWGKPDRDGVRKLLTRFIYQCDDDIPIHVMYEVQSPRIMTEKTLEDSIYREFNKKFSFEGLKYYHWVFSASRPRERNMPSFRIQATGAYSWTAFYKNTSCVGYKRKGLTNPSLLEQLKRNMTKGGRFVPLKAP